MGSTWPGVANRDFDCLVTVGRLRPIIRGMSTFLFNLASARTKMPELAKKQEQPKNSSAKRWSWRIIRTLLVAYLLILLLMTTFERWLVYPAPPASAGDWKADRYPHEDIEFASADGTKLHGWLFDRAEPANLIVYFHGNGEDVARNAARMNNLRNQLNSAVFIIDYRGYGKSEGSPNEAGVIADGIAAQKWMAERYNVETDEIVLMGRSLGGGVAIAAAAEQGAKAVVLQNTFARMVDTAAALHWYLPVKQLMQNRYDSIARIAKYDGPVFQTHGDRDELVSIADAKRLFAAVPGKVKKFETWEGAGHNDPPPPEYVGQLNDFLMVIRQPAAVAK